LPDSEISTDDGSEVAEDETLLERVIALRDIIPPTTRSYIASKIETTTSWLSSGLLLGGKTLFVVSTSALFLGVPWALAFADEQQMIEMEKEMKMREMGGEVGSMLIDHPHSYAGTITDIFGPASYPKFVDSSGSERPAWHTRGQTGVVI